MQIFTYLFPPFEFPTLSEECISDIVAKIIQEQLINPAQALGKSFSDQY